MHMSIWAEANEVTMFEINQTIIQWMNEWMNEWMNK